MENSGRRAAEQAIEMDSLDLLREILWRDPALLNHSEGVELPLLHLAAEWNRPEMTLLMLESGADRECKSRWGQTALEWAATLGHAEVAQALLSPGDRSNLYCDAALGRIEKIRKTLQEELWESTPNLIMFDKAEGLCRHTRDIEDREFVLADAFHVACRNGQTEVAQVLLAAGAPVDAEGMFGASALHWSAHNGHLSTVRFLVKAGGQIDQLDPRFEATALGWALENDHVDVARFLQRCRAGLNTRQKKQLKDLEGRPPDQSESGV